LALAFVSVALPLHAVADEVASELPPPSAELLAPRPRSAGQPSMHPSIVLRDDKGAPVLTSGEPASAVKTCDGCHDVRWIEAHDYHASLTAEELGRDPSTRVGGNCFLCHVRSADNPARLLFIGQGRLDGVDTATLAATGLVTSKGEGWQWRKERFQPDGTVAAATLGLGRPANRACGFCHGSVYEDPEPLGLARDPRQRMTDLEGVVFSSQRISDSAVNVANKDNLARPWDVHAERMVSCASCHFAPNHPAYSFASRGPEHLQFDARRAAITEYLRRPDHRLARGPSGTGEGRQEGSIRRCEGCHDATKAHRFLPRAERHFSALLCESCHVPMAYAPARQETDWTIPTATREARVVYRGIRQDGSADGFVPGFRPILLPRQQGDGTWKLGPNNLVTTWLWVERSSGGSRPVAREIIERAFFIGGAHRPELVAALDRNGDGKLQDGELALDSEVKVKLAAGLLVAAGARAPEIAGEIAAYQLHHGVAAGRFATRECSACHAANSILDQPFVLANAAPFGVTPSFVGQANPSGALAHDEQGRLVWEPRRDGLHVFGHTRSRALDGFGIFLLAGAIAGAGGHALLRVRSARGRNKEHA
jgi:hypothetical protein